MAAPSSTLLHSLTDRIAALMKLELAGLDNQLVAASVNSMGVLMDGAGDVSLEAAMMSLCNAVDDQSLPENYYNGLLPYLGRTQYRDWHKGIAAYMASTPGGSLGNFRAACTSIGAVVHPLYAELARSVENESLFTLSGDVTTVFAPNYAVRSPDRIYTGADGSLTDDTIDAADVGTADVALFASNNHYLYVGCRIPFSQLIAGLSTKSSASITPTFAYWNGNAWATLTVTDNSTGFQKNQNIKWTIPTDWVRSYKDTAGNELADKTPLYYIRIKRTNSSGITPPTATGIRLVPKAIFTANGGANHLGVDQPPLALVRVTAQDTVVVESIVNPDYTRFKEPTIRLRALSVFGADITPTVAYTDQDGNTGITQAQSGWTAPAAYDTVAVSLAGGDTGVRAIETSGWAATTTETDAIIAVEVVELRVPAL